MTLEPTTDSSGSAELVLKIGHDCKIFAETAPDSAPVVCIQAGSWQVLFYPLSGAEGMRLNQHEVDRASEIVIAFSQWRNAIAEMLASERDDTASDVQPERPGPADVAVDASGEGR